MKHEKTKPTIIGVGDVIVMHDRSPGMWCIEMIAHLMWRVEGLTDSGMRYAEVTSMAVKIVKDRNVKVVRTC